MSLEMYLNKRTYVGCGRNELKITAIKGRVDVARIKYVVEVVAYWRKANAIHQWFVDNVQNAEDDCKLYAVSSGQLKTLLELCEQVLKAPDKAPILLPTQEGFLFGSTEYDNRYFQNVDYTVEVLKSELSEDADESQEYEYQSSW